MIQIIGRFEAKIRILLIINSFIDSFYVVCESNGMKGDCLIDSYGSDV